MGDVTIRNAGVSPFGQKIREEGQAEVFAISVNEFENVSARSRLAFSWSMVPAILANADTLLLVQNDSDSLVLHIEEIVITLDTSSLVQIHLTDRATLTPSGGTAVTGVCINQTAPRVAAAIAFADEQTNAQGNIIWNHEIILDNRETVELHGAVLLSKGQSIAADVTTAQTIASCTIFGFYAIPDDERV